MSNKKQHQAVTVRLDLDVYRCLAQIAEQEKRSLNQQMTLVVEQWLQSGKPCPVPAESQSN